MTTNNNKKYATLADLIDGSPDPDAGEPVSRDEAFACSDDAIVVTAAKLFRCFCHPTKTLAYLVLDTHTERPMVLTMPFSEVTLFDSSTYACCGEVDAKGRFPPLVHILEEYLEPTPPIPVHKLDALATAWENRPKKQNGVAPPSDEEEETEKIRARPMVPLAKEFSPSMLRAQAKGQLTFAWMWEHVIQAIAEDSKKAENHVGLLNWFRISSIAHPDSEAGDCVYPPTGLELRGIIENVSALDIRDDLLGPRLGGLGAATVGDQHEVPKEAKEEAPKAEQPAATTTTTTTTEQPATTTATPAAPTPAPATPAPAAPTPAAPTPAAPTPAVPVQQQPMQPTAQATTTMQQPVMMQQPNNNNNNMTMWPNNNNAAWQQGMMTNNAVLMQQKQQQMQMLQMQMLQTTQALQATTVAQSVVSSSNFPRNLYRLLMGGRNAIISWDHEGATFRVHAPDVLVLVLPRYGIPGDSFVRNLARHGFKAITHGAYRGGYNHPYFHRDHPEWLDHVIPATRAQEPRRTSKAKTAKKAAKTEAAAEAKAADAMLAEAKASFKAAADHVAKEAKKAEVEAIEAMLARKAKAAEAPATKETATEKPTAEAKEGADAPAPAPAAEETSTEKAADNTSSTEKPADETEAMEIETAAAEAPAAEKPPNKTATEAEEAADAPAPAAEESSTEKAGDKTEKPADETKEQCAAS